MKWYTTNHEEVMEILETSQTGLSSADRKERLEKNGENKLTVCSIRWGLFLS